MFGGFSLIFFYVAATLGRWNALEQRVSSFIEALFLSFVARIIALVYNSEKSDELGSQDYEYTTRSDLCSRITNFNFDWKTLNKLQLTWLS